MTSVAQRIPEDVLEIVFTQDTLTKIPLISEQGRTHGLNIVETDLEISGARWAKQSTVLDRGLSLPYHPNYDLHRLLLVCKSWFPSVQRALYRSIAIGLNSEDQPDPRVYRRLLRTLKASPMLASIVQHLDLWLDSDENLAGYGILGRCTQVKNVHVYGFHGGSTAKRRLLRAMCCLGPRLESFAIHRYGTPSLFSDPYDFSGEVFSAGLLFQLTKRWPKLHTLVMLDGIVDDDLDEDESFNDTQAPPDAPTALICPQLQKLCIHRCQPSTSFLRSVVLSPNPPTLQVLRCGLDTLSNKAYFTLLRKTLLVLAPELRHLTLTSQEDFELEENLQIIDEVTAPRFQQLVELQTCARIMPASCLVKFPKLKYLGYDTMDFAELMKLLQVVCEHKTLRGLQFCACIDMTPDGPPAWLENPEESNFEDVPLHWRIILATKSVCERRNIQYGFSYRLNVDEDDHGSEDSDESEWADYYNSDEDDGSSSDDDEEYHVAEESDRESVRSNGVEGELHSDIDRSNESGSASEGSGYDGDDDL